MKDTPSSAGSLPSLLLTQVQEKGTAASSSSDTTIDAPAVAQNKNDLLDRDTSRRSSSSTLGETESTAAVADTVDSDDENKLTFDIPDLKNILSEVELMTGNSASDWLGEVMEGEGKEERMTAQHYSSENTHFPTMQKSSRNSPISSPQYGKIMIQGKIIGADEMRLCTPPPMKFQQRSTPQASHPAVNTPTRPLSMQNNINISSSSSCNNNTQREWIDPFPTPDVSIHSMYGSPCSSSAIRGFDDYNELTDTEEKRQTIIHPIPTFPPIEEFSDLCKLSPSIAAGGAKLAGRKVCSESNLSLIERFSMESFWGALNSGPDGNELSECNNNDFANMKNKKPHQRRHSEIGMSQQRMSLECLNDSEHQATTPPRLTDKRYLIHRSSTAPVDLPGEGIRIRSMQNPKSASCNGYAHATNQTYHGRIRLTPDPHNDWVPENPKYRTNMRFRALRIKSSKAVASAKNSAGEVFSPVRTVVQQSTQRAAKLVRHTRQRLKERKELRKQRRFASSSPPRSWWIIIPADHPYKIIWDVLTMLWAAFGAYRTHVRIRDRVFDQSPLIILTEVWFTVDILLNFITEHKTSEGDVIRDGKAVWARYLTTWFVIDILSLIPWERIYVRPIVERMKRRNFFQKTFFRSKAVVRVSRVLRGRHIKLFGRVSKRTGMSLHRMVALLIKYLPKYLLFLRNMKGALVFRALRFIHWLHEIYKKIWVKARNARQSLAVRRPLFSPNEIEFESESDDDDMDDDEDDDDDDDNNDDESDIDDQPRRRLFTES